MRLIGAAHRRCRATTTTDSCVLAFVQALLLNWCAGRDMSARRGPLVVGLELQAELVVEDTQIAVAAAQYRRGHDRFDFLRHHADIGLVAAVVAEAIEAEAVIEMAEEGDVVLRADVGHSHAAANAAAAAAAAHAAAAAAATHATSAAATAPAATATSATHATTATHAATA